jgi:hypothetical protein
MDQFAFLRMKAFTEGGPSRRCANGMTPQIPADDQRLIPVTKQRLASLRRPRCVTRGMV